MKEFCSDRGLAHPMVRRHAALEACMSQFAKKPYRPGTKDCGRMALFMLKRLGVPTRMLKGVTWSTEQGGLRCLRRLGFTTLREVADALGLPRIAPARALPGDVIELQSNSPLGALAVYVGNGRALGYLEGEDCAQVIQPSEILNAWRVI